MREPRGRRVGGRADDDGDVMLRGESDGAVQPVEIVVAFGRLQRGPGELADAHDVHVRVLHQLQVVAPTATRATARDTMRRRAERSGVASGDGWRCATATSRRRAGEAGAICAMTRDDLSR